MHDGEWYDDSDAPYRQENFKRMPCSGAAVTPDGRLFLIEVDGRQPEVSVGVTRREFAALMRAFGATEGLLLDGGGSSTLVVRRLGDALADVVNSPSDGKERPVADGLFVYSSAPVGPPVRLVARPGIIRALDGAEVPLRVAAVDAADNVANDGAAIGGSVEPSALGTFRDGEFVALRARWAGLTNQALEAAHNLGFPPGAGGGGGGAIGPGARGGDGGGGVATFLLPKIGISHPSNGD